MKTRALPTLVVLALLIVALLPGCNRSASRPPTPSPSGVEVARATVDRTPTPEPTESVPTAESTVTPTRLPTVTPTRLPTVPAKPTVTPTRLPTVLAKPTASPRPTATPEPTETPEPTATHTPQPTYTPTRAAQPEPEPGWVTHIVQPGENLYRIGLQYGINWQRLAEANGLADAHALYAGQVLLVPGREPETAPPPFIVHIVQPGENLYRIGLQYDLPWRVIAQANDIQDPRDIYSGMELKIPAAGQ